MQPRESRSPAGPRTLAHAYPQARARTSSLRVQVQQELAGQLAASLRVPPNRVAIATMYAAGRFTVVDLLPGAAGAPTPAAVRDGLVNPHYKIGPPLEQVTYLGLLRALVRAVSDLDSALFDTRVLGRLDSIKELLGPGGSDEAVLAEGIGEAGEGSSRLSLLDMLKLTVFAGGVLLALALLVGICYGACIRPMLGGGAASDPQLASVPLRSPSRAIGIAAAASSARRKRSATRGTTEERRGLGRSAYSSSDEEEV